MPRFAAAFDRFDLGVFVLNASPVQVLMVLAIGLLIFGPKRLPELGRNLGRGLRGFSAAMNDEPAAPPEAPGSERATLNSSAAASTTTGAAESPQSSARH